MCRQPVGQKPSPRPSNVSAPMAGHICDPTVAPEDIVHPDAIRHMRGRDSYNTNTVIHLLRIYSNRVGNFFHDWPGYFVFIPSHELRYVKDTFDILRHMQTGPSKNDVGPLETVVLETKHQQIALKAVEAAYLIECPLDLGTRAPEPILDWGRGPPERPSCQHRREPNNPRARHMVQTQHPKIHSHNPMPTPGCTDLHRHCDSAPLACP